MGRAEKVKADSRVVSIRISDAEYWLLKALAVEKRMTIGTLVMQCVRRAVKQKAQAA